MYRRIPTIHRSTNTVAALIKLDTSLVCKNIAFISSHTVTYTGIIALIRIKYLLLRKLLTKPGLSQNSNCKKKQEIVIFYNNLLNSTLMKEIIERIRDLRRIRGYSYENMATGLKISVSAYRKIEKNETNLTVERLFQIAKLLKTSVHQLIDINGLAYYQQEITDNEITLAHHNPKGQNKLDYKEIHTRLLHLEDQFLFLTTEFKMIQSLLSGNEIQIKQP